MVESAEDPGRARIRLGARIGRGGMAEVFAARLVGAAGFEKDVAVKRVLPRFSGNPVFLARFLHEGRLAARLSHPNVVQIFELGNDGNDHYLVMEAVRGVTLRAAIGALRERHEEMPLGIVVHVMEGLCAGLAHAHGLKDGDGAPLDIVHRDVSPQNVLLGFDGVVKLIDFGIARAATQSGLTEVGTVVGKAEYLAPEQIAGAAVDARADLFALGVILYELLAGRRPFQGEDADVMARIAAGQREPLLRAAPRMDRRLAEIAERALATSPDERWASARAMGIALRNTGLSSRTNASDIEALLQRLFPAQSVAPWPVGGTSDGRSLTERVEREREIQLVTTMDEAATGPGSLVSLALAPARRKRRRAAPVLAGLALGLAVVTVLWGLAPVSRGKSDGTPPSSEPVDARGPVGVACGGACGGSASIPIVTDATADAGAALATPEPTDAGADATREIARPAAPPTPVRRHAAKTGTLNVETRPWSQVFLDGKQVGITPLSIAVPVGSHTLLMRSKQEQLEQSVAIEVTAEKATTLRLDLRRPAK